MTISKNSPTITVQEYANIFKCDIANPTIQTIQEYVEENYDETIWDYPIDELDYVLSEVSTNVVLVIEEDNIRICELI